MPIDINCAASARGLCVTKAAFGLLGFGLCLGSISCSSALAPFFTDTRTAADKAREVEPRCKWVKDDSVAQLLEPSGVDRVEPELAYVQSGNDRRPNLIGARVYLRPLPGMSAENMTRTLECHQARATLGQIRVLSGDPYVLPGRWLDVDAISDVDDFAIRIRTNDIADARVVLARARTFANTPL